MARACRNRSNSTSRKGNLLESTKSLWTLSLCLKLSTNFAEVQAFWTSLIVAIRFLLWHIEPHAFNRWVDGLIKADGAEVHMFLDLSTNLFGVVGLFPSGKMTAENASAIDLHRHKLVGAAVSRCYACTEAKLECIASNGDLAGCSNCRRLSKKCRRLRAHMIFTDQENKNRKVSVEAV